MDNSSRDSIAKRASIILTFLSIGTILFFMISSGMKSHDESKGSVVVLRKSLSHYDSAQDFQFLGRRRTQAANGNNNNNKEKVPLEFVHITKTGGSSIEKAAAAAGILWGTCHFQAVKTLGCESPDTKRYGVSFLGGGEPWHLPLRYLTGETYVGDADSFVVVRNPYTRAISEYYCNWKGYRGPDQNKPEKLNEYIVEHAKMAGSSTHFMPQSLYVYDENGKRMVNHVLKFEEIQEEFPKLMRQYGLDQKIVLPKEHTNSAHGSGRMTVKDLSRETIQVLNEAYEMDFKLFGYDMARESRDFERFAWD